MVVVCHWCTVHIPHKHSNDLNVCFILLRLWSSAHILFKFVYTNRWSITDVLIYEYCKGGGFGGLASYGGGK